MNARRSLAVFALVLVLVFSFSACAGKSAEPDAADMAAPQEVPQSEEMGYAYGSEASGSDIGLASLAGGMDEADGGNPSPSEKIIYSGYAEIETLQFDKTLEDLEKMILENGGFIQSSSVNGNDFDTSYYGGKSYRSADYSIRIPADKFKSVTESLNIFGNVPYSSTNAQNITMQYRDTAARLTARQTEQTRLLELLAKANTIEEILQIETRLSEVRYDIESLNTQIKGWDDLISYSTLDLSIREVTLYTEGSTATLSYGEQLSEGFVRTLKGVGRFFQDTFKLIIISLPVLLILAAIAVAVIFIVKTSRKKQVAKIVEKQEQDRKDS